MGSHTHQSFQHPNSALLRFRSAPSSLFVDFAQGVDSKRSNQFEGSESERLVSRFVNRSGGGGGGNNNDSESPAAGNRVNCHHPDYASGLPPHYPRQNSAVTPSSSSSSSSSSSMSSSYGLLGSNLARQSSSPPGAFSHLNQNGYGGMRSSGEGNYSRLSGNNNGGEVSLSSNRLNSQISFSSLLPSSLGMLSQISDQVGNEKLANSNGEAQFFSPSGFPFASWNESSRFCDTFPGVKRDPDSNRKLFSSHQNGESGGNRVHLLSHHLSLPKNASDIASIEKLLQLQDAVPCRIRAKRGCATHPRSIAERVRRTRISERMRKLQELVPNMDKQTNTADMLDLAVDYIKELQKQFKTLSDNRAKCVCLNMQKPVSNQIM